MNDHLQDDARFEQHLRVVLAGLAPDVAPASLRAAVTAVPRRGAGHALGRTTRQLAAMGLAAAVVIAVVGIGLVGGRLPIGPAAVPASGGPPPEVPSPSSAMVSLTFDVVTPDGSMATKPQTDAVGSVMQERLRAYGIGTFSSSYSDDRITFEMALPDTSPAAVAAVRDLLGAPGSIEMFLLGANPIEPGEPVGGQPLLTPAAFTNARVGTDQSGDPTLDLAIDAQTATSFADTTRTHVGDYLAIALDGVAVAVPVINDEIPDGLIQVSFAAGDTTPARLAAIIQAGLSVPQAGPDPARLPLPVVEVTP